MSLTLTTHDTRFDDPDGATIAKVLASLDGDRNVLATLERSEVTYLQAEGSAQTGFALEYQEGAIHQRYRSRAGALPLGQVTEIFQAYARADAAWRQGLAVGPRALRAAQGPLVQHLVGLYARPLGGRRSDLVVARVKIRSSFSVPPSALIIPLRSGPRLGR